jgi:hypothetical protein
MALTVAPAMLSASDNATEAKERNVPTGKFAALKDVKVVPMSSSELKEVRGLHFHFTTPSGKELLVNIQKGLDTTPPTPTPNPDPSSTFPFIVGKGYRGLCGAALNAVGLVIPGQNTTTGIGGGCE